TPRGRAPHHRGAGRRDHRRPGRRLTEEGIQTVTEPPNATTYEAGTRPPVRIVHLGLGAFHRAHQAWYTQRAGDGWGIAAFTGRSPDAAEVLAAQDGLYTLVVRGPDGDSHEVITSVVTAHDGADLAALAALVA